MASPESGEIELTRDAILSEADTLAQSVLHMPAREALERVQQGDLEGTLFASKLIRLFALLGEDAPPSNDVTHAAAE